MRNSGQFPPGPLTSDIDTVVALYESGKTMSEIGVLYGVTQPAVSNLFRRNGIPARPQNWRRYDLDESVFDTITDASAYWIGFLMADGCVMRQHGGKSSANIAVTLSTVDIKHLYKLRAFLGANNPIPIAEATDTYKSRCTLRVTSNRLASRLAIYGIVPRKTKYAQAHYVEHLPAFWRGVLDGDGSLEIRETRPHYLMPILQIYGSRPLMAQFWRFAKNQIPGWQSHVRTGQYNFGTSVSGNRCKTLVKLLYDGASVALDRKMSIARNIMAWSR